MVSISHRFQPRQQPEQNDLWYTQIPLDVIWGIYARQSTPAQVLQYTESTEMQTDDLVTWLIDRGIQDGQWQLFDADLGVSGTLRIDQRTGLQELVERIKADEIKAVLVYQISRLFRDDTGVQYNVFANICKEHNCLLVTSDGMVFNFNNRMHLKMFRFLAEWAAEYIPQQIGLLHAARLRKTRKGLYAGLGAVPSGYIVDYQKTSPTYRRFIIYELHARVVLWIFVRFYELEGNFLTLCRELEAMPFVFPLFESSVDPRSVVRCRRKQVPGGYHITRHGLETLLTNPVYIGWWIVQGDVVSRSNHEPIIDKEHEYLFWYAFNRLSEYTVEGERNEHRTRKQEQRRFYQRQTTEQAGLLKERIAATNGSVHVHMDKNEHRYVLILPQKVLRKVDTGIEVSVIDDAFTKRFFERLQETHDFDEYRRWIAESTQRQVSLIETIKTQLAEIERQQEAILDEKLAIRTQINESIREAHVANPTLDREELKKRLEEEAAPDFERLQKRAIKLNTLAAELSAKLPNPQEQEKIQTARKFADFQTELQRLIPVWPDKPFDVRKEFVNLFVRQAVLEIVSAHWISLTIEWSHPKWESDILYIFRRRGAMPNWTDEEQEIIRTHYPHASRDALLALLPDKSWVSIRTEALKLGVEREGLSYSKVPKNLTWSDWQFMQQFGMEEGDRTTKCVSSSRRLASRSVLLHHSRAPSRSHSPGERC